jgi:hypothetical protein
MDNVKKKDKGISFFFLLNYLFGCYKQNNMFSIFSIFTWIINIYLFIYLFLKN